MSPADPGSVQHHFSTSADEADDVILGVLFVLLEISEECGLLLISSGGAV